MAQTQLVDTLTLLASGAKTTSSNGSAVDLKGNLSGAVVVNVTAVSGTTPNLVAHIEGSFDGGTTWTDVLYSEKIQKGPDASDVTGSTNSRNIMNNQTTTGIAYARYEYLPPLVRLKWYVTGTSPSFTMSSLFVGS